MAFGRISTGAQPIAIEFGVGALKALQITSSEPPALVGAACIETPDELRGDHAKRFAFQAAALPKLLRVAHFKGKRVICSIPAPQTLVQHMQVQRTDGVPLTTLVGAQLQTQLSCDPSQVVIRPFEVCEVVKGGAAKMEVICIAAAREVVLRQVQALRECKLETVGVHSEHVALVRAFDHLTQRDEDKSVVTLYLDLGCGTTKICIAHGKDLVFAKTIHVAGRTLDEYVAHQTRATLAEARPRRLAMTQLTREPIADPAEPEQGEPSDGGGAGAGMAVLAAGARTAPASGARTAPRVAASFDPPEADLAEPLESLTDEIAMCLRYHAAIFPGRKVERAFFVGGEARHIALCQHIARALRLSARVADPLAQVARTGKEPCVGVDLSTSQPGWAVPFGLSLCPADL